MQLFIFEVAPATVMNAEAYVLFYRKNTDQVQGILRELSLAGRETNISLGKHISVCGRGGESEIYFNIEFFSYLIPSHYP